MANWSNPTLTSLYTDFVNEVKNRDVDLALGLDPATATSTSNLPTNAIRWNSVNFKWEKYNGTSWADLASKYIFTSVEVSGTTVPANGMYRSATNTLDFATASTAGRLTIDASGNVNIDSNTLYVDAVNNRVGIGTTTPGSTLDVQGALSATANSGSFTLRGRASGAPGGDSYIYFQSLNSNFSYVTSAYIRSVLSTTTANGEGGDLFIATMDPAAGSPGSALVDRVKIDSLGNVTIDTNTLYVDAVNNRVGIGITSPVSLLDAYGTITAGTKTTAGAGDDVLFTNRINLGIISQHASSGAFAYGYGVKAGSTSGTWLSTYDASSIVRLANTVGSSTGFTWHSEGTASATAPGSAVTLSEILRLTPAGRILLGTNTARVVEPFGLSTSGISPNIIENISTIDPNKQALLICTNSSTTAANGPALSLARSRGAALNDSTVVQSGDNLGTISFAGADGTDIRTKAAAIFAESDATTVITAGSFVIGRPYKILSLGSTDFTLIGASANTVGTIFTATGVGTGTGTATTEPYVNSMPGRIIFATTAEGAAVTAERLRIANDGRHTINSNAHQGTALSTTAPANLYVSTGTYTDTATAASGIVTHGTITAFGNPSINSTNTGVTYTNASTVYIAGAPAGTGNVTVTNGFALFVAAGASRFGGSVLSSSATAGLGYVTGAGGAVTQATSRTTGVTLNTICGAITLVSAAGTATWQSFTVTNSAVAATDTVIVNQKSGTDLYMMHVTNVAAGSFRITFATTGGTTTEQPVFNFSVIKAVAA